jgi:flagellar basal body-associated protein FliL
MLPMNKNVLIVFVVILTPIVIMGALAVAGAENFEKQKEAAENENPEANLTENAGAIAPLEMLKVYGPQSSDMFMSSGLRSLA